MGASDVMTRVTRKQKELLALLRASRDNGLTVAMGANKLDITYAGAYKHFRDLERKRCATSSWEKKGNKKRFYPK